MTGAEFDVQKDAVLLLGHGSQDPAAVEEIEAFARQLGERMSIVVRPAYLEFAQPSLATALSEGVESGANRIIALPLVLGPATHQKNDMPAAIQWARQAWPNVAFHFGAPLGAQVSLVEALADRVNAAIDLHGSSDTLHETAVVVVGRGSRDPDSNSEVAKMARLLWEGRGYGWVEFAFYSLTTPGVAAAIDRCVRLGARFVIVASYLLFSGRILDGIARQGEERAAASGVRLAVAGHLGLHDGVFDAVKRQYQTVAHGTPAMNCDLCKYRRRFAGFEPDFGLAQGSDHHHGLRGIGLTGASAPVLVAGAGLPMAAAPLVYDSEGSVAWNRIWADFCELASAGGPPHRGDLLEPVNPDEVAADPAGAGEVTAEIERGIRMTTGLPVQVGPPGWIGVECNDEAMARWLLLAIVAENIAVRREGTTLFLPSGPAFRLDIEIKSIVTVVAKTHHYWTDHVRRG